MFLKFVGLLLCPVLEICSRVHKRVVYVCSNDSTIEWHLSLETCELSPEKVLHLRPCKTGVRLSPSGRYRPFAFVTSPSLVCVSRQRPRLQGRLGLRLKNLGTPRSLNWHREESRPRCCTKEMRRARGPNGEKLFAVTKILSAQQISSFFSRLAAKCCQQEVQAGDRARCARGRRAS